MTTKKTEKKEAKDKKTAQQSKKQSSKAKNTKQEEKKPARPADGEEVKEPEKEVENKKEKSDKEKFEEIKNLEATSKLKIWILDTWIDTTHSDLQTNINKTLWYNFITEDNNIQDNQGHWTHIAWIIWANLNNQWIVWINPYVELVPLKICDENGFCPNYAVIKSLEYAKENEINILKITI